MWPGDIFDPRHRQPCIVWLFIEEISGIWQRMIKIQVWKAILPWGFIMRVGESPLQETVAGEFAWETKTS